MDSIKRPAALIASSAFIIVAGVSASGFTPPKTPPVHYKEVQAIFDTRCIGCHRAPKPRAQMNLESFAGLTKGNDHGPVIAAGHPEKSLLYQLITSTGRKQMPPKVPLSKADIAKIAAWIKAGAKNK